MFASAAPIIPLIEPATCLPCGPMCLPSSIRAGTIYDWLNSQKTYTKVLGLIDRADYKHLFNADNADLTFLAVNDRDMPPTLNPRNMTLSQASDFLAPHMIDRRMPVALFKRSKFARFATRDRHHWIPVVYLGGCIMVANAKFLMGDIRATNGLIHVVNRPIQLE